MEEDRVLTSRSGSVGLMTLNRAESMNTLDVPMLLALETALDQLEADPEVRVIIVTGSDDRTFIAGANIADLDTRRGLRHYEEFAVLGHRVLRRFEECLKPTIAAVNGWALGGGAEFLLAIDIRLMAQEAQMGFPEIKFGLFPGGGGSQRLMRQISPCQAKLLMFTGDFISADEALRLGLVNRVVSRARLHEEAMALACRIAEKSPVALRMLKASMLHGADMPMPAALAYEAATISLVLDSEDAHEGCRAFLEKRRPAFSGR